MTLRHLFLTFATFCLLSSASSAYAIERFNIDIDRDTSLLPYRFNAQKDVAFTGDPDSPAIARTARVAQIYQGDSGDGRAVTARNQSVRIDQPAVFSLFRTRIWKGDDKLIKMVVTGWDTYRDHLSGNQIVVGCGYHNDTAWAFCLNLETGEQKLAFLATGTDARGHGWWIPELYFCLLNDYDFDGHPEAFIHFKAGVGRLPRELLCVEAGTMQLEWSLPLAAEVLPEYVYSCNDSANPAIILAAQSSGQGVSDSEFSSDYGYVTKIDRSGRILCKQIVNSHPGTPILIPAESAGQFLLTHNIDFAHQGIGADSGAAHYYLSKISDTFQQVKAIALGDRAPVNVWIRDFSGFGKCVFVIQTGGVVRVYDRDFAIVGESNPIHDVRSPVRFLGEIMLPGRAEHDFVYNNGVYSKDFQQLLSFPFDAGSCEIVSKDSSGAAARIMITTAGRYVVGSIEHKGFAELLPAYYFSYRLYILMGISALVMTLILTNFYRRRTKRNLIVITQQKREIESTHTELEKTYEALKLAQSKIIAQEKYLQAKSIAGGFAHEIRNTLFPAEGAIHNLTGLLSKSGVMDAKIDRAIDALKTATARAIQLTEVISSYTKLETPLPTERIPIAHVVGSVLERNSSMIESIGAKVVTDGSETCSIAANIEHLQAIFNNLLVNALDALTNTANPCIMIAWSEGSRTIRVRFSDNGTGISEDHSKRIFEPFYSTKPYKGTGLGLSIVKKIVELYEGSITVSSEIGEGTVFEIELRTNNDANVSN